jgi:hypothetical protein
MTLGWPGCADELGVEVRVKASDGVAVVLPRARVKNMVGSTTAKAAAKVGREVTNRDARSRAG